MENNLNLNSNKISIRKRNGNLEDVNLEKIIKATSKHSEGLNVDSVNVAIKTISGIFDGASTKELDMLSIRTAANMSLANPDYGKLATRILDTYINKEVKNTSNGDIESFSQSITSGYNHGLYNQRLLDFVTANSRKLNQAIKPERTYLFTYMGLSTVYDRYLKRHPTLRTVIETPQYFWMRIASALSNEDPKEAVRLYDIFSTLHYIPSSPTLFNAGCKHEQLSSCYLLDSPSDDLLSIYRRYSDIAQLSKFAGGIGVSYSRIRSQGSLIKGTNGFSNGVVPWLKTLNSSVDAVQQGGLRRGAACVYLETWHDDIMSFLELRDNTGDENRRTHDLNLANWVPDIFMRRVKNDEMWSLFDPKDVPNFPDLYGTAFEEAYEKAEREGLAKRQIKARDIYTRMMRTLASTGNGWMNFKDRANLMGNQVGHGKVIHLSNLCTEILEVNTEDETAVCNLGSVNLSTHVVEKDGKLVFDFDLLKDSVETAVKQLNRVIDINFYPIDGAKKSNEKWRPIGLGLMGLHDVFFKLKLDFDSQEAQELSTKIQQVIYFNAINTSMELAKVDGPHETFKDTKLAQGILHPDLWVAENRASLDPSVGNWDELRSDVKKNGVRNSLTIAIAPTATIASIAGCYECTEPQVSNMFKKETLSGDFLIVNPYLVDELIGLNLWDKFRDRIVSANGSIQNIAGLPDDVKSRFRTAWELPQKVLINLAVARAAFIDQSQSLNLFVEAPNIGKLSSMYMYAWESGVKTTYYLRSRPATSIAKTFSVDGESMDMADQPEQPKKVYSDEEALVCSLENPEACEACQ
jgi:ribonucleoside-diphosphate reductase alpha chain